MRGNTFLTLPENNKFRYIDTPFPIYPSKFDIIYQTSNFNLRTIETKEKSIKQINKANREWSCKGKRGREKEWYQVSCLHSRIYQSKD